MTDASFERLLHPVTVADFWTNHWGRRYLHRVHENGTPFLFPLALFDRLLQNGLLPAGFVGVVNRGQQVPQSAWATSRKCNTGSALVALPEKLLQHYLAGCTLWLNRVSATIPEIGDFCRTVAVEIGARVGANCYITPPSAQGFTRHSDPHEVFALQITGSKEWRLFPAGGDEITVTLQAGDLLYVPRGLEHIATTTGQPSVHITIGVTPPYEFDALGMLARAASELPALQVAVRPDAEEFIGPWSQITHGMENSSPAQLLRARRRQFIEDQRAGWAGHLTDVLRISELGPESRVRRRREVAIERTVTDGQLELRFGTSVIQVPAFLAAMVDRLISGEAVTVRHLPGLASEAQKAELVRRFVSIGLLRIDRPVAD